MYSGRHSLAATRVMPITNCLGGELRIRTRRRPTYPLGYRLSVEVGLFNPSQPSGMSKALQRASLEQFEFPIQLEHHDPWTGKAKSHGSSDRGSALFRRVRNIFFSGKLIRLSPVSHSVQYDIPAKDVI